MRKQRRLHLNTGAEVAPEGGLDQHLDGRQRANLDFRPAS
jgi:hypothetical protein